jgi:hypothetical protein
VLSDTNINGHDVMGVMVGTSKKSDGEGGEFEMKIHFLNIRPVLIDSTHSNVSIAKIEGPEKVEKCKVETENDENKNRSWEGTIKDFFLL